MSRPGPQIVAHRGASEDEAEHTLAAYLRALDAGADALECDVRLTRDGALVCVHDRRVDRTSSGRGVVSTLELADLSELDFGSWHAGPLSERPDPLLTAEWEEPDWDRMSVLTLERLLEVVRDWPDPVELAVETKHPTRYAGLVELALTELLAKFGMTRPDAEGRSRVRVMSFAATSLRRVHALAPHVPTVYLMRRTPLRYRDGSLPPRVSIAGPSLALVRRDPDYVARVHAHGGRVHVWTVNDAADVELVARLGVDAIITNRPAKTRRIVDAMVAR